MRRPTWILFCTAMFLFILFGCTLCVAQEEVRIERSVLVRIPRPELIDNGIQINREQLQQRIQEQYQQQQYQPQQYQQVQPQVIYMQAPQPQVAAPVHDHWQNYIRYKMWFNANYEQRGLLFKRYVRRDPRDTLFRYMMYSRMMQ